jgi:hypothetical protein
MRPYQYLPLSSKANSIRIITLLPVSASDSNEIRILLDTIQIQRGNESQYEALSYTWGSAEDPVAIYVGASGDQIISVTQNLASALQYLRHETEERHLWVDAVCIDQKNLQERSEQVLKMADVYQIAKRAVVWLGAGNEETIKGTEIIRQLASKLEVDWDLMTMKPSAQARQSDDLSWADRTIRFPYTKEDFDAIHSILSCPWFERLWIRQEIWLTSENAVLLCGRQTLSWTDFRNAVFCLGQKRSAHEEHIKHIRNRIELIFPLCDNVGFTPISTLLRNGQAAKCSDPRDRVFGILSMIDESEKIIDIQPDYTKSTAEVYQDVALRFIDKIQTLALLDSCNLDGKQLGMPTWVPNWNASAEGLTTAHLASGYSSFEAVYLHPGILEVGGVQVATIKEACFANLGKYTLESVVSAIREFAPVDLEAKYPTGCTVFDGYCYALCCDSFSANFLPPREVRPKLKLAKTALRQFLDPSAPIDKLAPGELRYVDYVWPYLRDNRFITTLEGYMGFGSSAAKPGDIVCALLGFNELMLLRPEEDGKYEVVGPAFLHGLMNCEGLLGPLPAPYEAVVTFAAALQEYWYGFVNRETEEFQSEDPRKPPLPPGWKKKEHSGDSWNDLYINEETGEDSREYDPRLRFGSLLHAGVKVEKFSLV